MNIFQIIESIFSVIIHSRFHRSDEAIANINTHDLWNDVEVVQGTDSIYLYLMQGDTIPSRSIL